MERKDSLYYQASWGIKGSQYCFLPIFAISCSYKCMHLWQKYTYVCVFHSFLIVFSFAVTLSESQDKPLASCSIQKKRLNVLKSVLNLPVYIEES